MASCLTIVPFVFQGDLSGDLRLTRKAVSFHTGLTEKKARPGTPALTSAILDTWIQVAFNEPTAHLFIVDDDQLDNHDVDEVPYAGIPVHRCYL